jgi:hypothetical protein
VANVVAEDDDGDVAVAEDNDDAVDEGDVVVTSDGAVGDGDGVAADELAEPAGGVAGLGLEVGGQGAPGSACTSTTSLYFPATFSAHTGAFASADPATGFCSRTGNDRLRSWFWTTVAAVWLCPASPVMQVKVRVSFAEPPRTSTIPDPCLPPRLSDTSGTAAWRSCGGVAH